MIVVCCTFCLSTVTSKTVCGYAPLFCPLCGMLTHACLDAITVVTCMLNHIIDLCCSLANITRCRTVHLPKILLLGTIYDFLKQY